MSLCLCFQRMWWGRCRKWRRWARVQPLLWETIQRNLWQDFQKTCQRGRHFVGAQVCFCFVSGVLALVGNTAPETLYAEPLLRLAQSLSRSADSMTQSHDDSRYMLILRSLHCKKVQRHQSLSIVAAFGSVCLPFRHHSQAFVSLCGPFQSSWVSSRPLSIPLSPLVAPFSPVWSWLPIFTKKKNLLIFTFRFYKKNTMQGALETTTSKPFTMAFWYESRLSPDSRLRSSISVIQWLRVMTIAATCLF